MTAYTPTHTYTDILLDSQGHVKLTDFGLSKDRIFGDETSSPSSAALLRGSSSSSLFRSAGGGSGGGSMVARTRSMDASTTINATRTFCGERGEW
jgi:serine/threonine protein kinase